jgi:hypothetical protein
MFFSFILSLALVDWRNSSLRYQGYSPNVPLTAVGRARGVVYDLLFRHAPYLYAYITRPEMGRVGEEQDG